MAANGVWGIDVDGAQTNGGGIVGDVDVTVDSLCVVYDHGTTTFALLSNSGDLTGWTNPFQLSADAANEEAGTDADGQTDGDAVYVGADVPFPELAVVIGTPGVMAAKVWRWEYYNGTQWNQIPTASFFDNTDLTNQDGEQSFEQGGAVSFIPPADWTATAILSLTKFWVRARVVAAQITTTPIAPTLPPVIVTPLAGFTCPHGGTITGIRLSDAATTLHTTADVKFILMNFTTGAHSGELTFLQDRRQGDFTGLTLAVNQGDVLGVLNTQEDGTAEPSNVSLELQVSG